MPRTKEEFDKWFKESNGDPWGYYHKSVRNRFRRSIDFIRRFVDDKFNGNILELGAFNGDFSIILCSMFHNAKIIINDISEVALAEARNKTSMCNNAEYYCEDLLNIKRISVDGKETIILMLECLYYLKPEERKTALENIKNNFPQSSIFISAPMIGRNYFTEDELLRMFNNLGYSLIAYEVLNLRKLGFLNNYVKSDLLRNKFANQMIFYFKPGR